MTKNFRHAAFVACFIATTNIMGCHRENDNDINTVRIFQKHSQLGETKKWPISSPLLLKRFQKIRDDAYKYCIEVGGDKEKCFSEQDMSIINAAQVVQFVGKNDQAGAEKRRSAGSQGEWVAPEPSLFRYASKYCLSNYNTNLSKDARSLGPCYVSAVGGDYFGVSER